MKKNIDGKFIGATHGCKLTVWTFRIVYASGCKLRYN